MDVGLRGPIHVRRQSAFHVHLNFTTLGGVKASSTISVASDGTASVPNATSTTPGLVEVVENTTTPVVPTRVASFQETEITVTSAQTVLTYMSKANHNFDLNLSFRVVTGTTTVTIEVTYTDAGGAETYYVLNAQSCAVDNYACVPFSFNATTGGAITVSITASSANQMFVSGSLKAV